MPLSYPQAKVLNALSISTQPHTAAELAAQANLSVTTARIAARELSRQGLASNTDKIPTRWQITPQGRRVLTVRPYRDYT